MKLPFFGGSFVARLRENAQPNSAQYTAANTWLDSFSGGRKYIHESRHVVDPAPTLIVSSDPKHDAENAKRIYLWLKGLDPALAMEERLWAYLTHCVFADYMAARWPVDGSSAVHRRYLFEGKTFAALSRNGIARLWWAGYLTRDERRENPFELTDVLFLRQDIHVSLLERAIGKCANVRTAVLEFLRLNSSWLSEEAFGKRIQVILRELNLLGGVVILDTLPLPEMEAFLQKVGLSFVQSGKTATAGQS